MKTFLPPTLILLAACSSPTSPGDNAAEAQSIKQRIEVMEDGDLLMRKKTDTSSNADSVVEVAWFKGGHLVKYEQGVYVKDTVGMVRFYIENDSLVFSEDFALKDEDTLQRTRLYFKHGECIQSEGGGKVDPKFTFLAGQAIVGLNKKDHRP